MQKKIIALAVAGLVSGVAFAQSNVTIYGVADANYYYANGDNLSKTGIDSGGHSGSRIGFKGEEALGNGLKAIFTMEFGTEIDGNGVGKVGDENVTGTDGALGSARQAFVGLDTSVGAFTAGRQYAPSYVYYGRNSANDVTMNMPINTMQGDLVKGFNGTMTTGGASRWNNSVAWQSKNYSGFEARAIYAFGEQREDDRVADGMEIMDDGKFGLGVNYANGPFQVTAIYQARMNVNVAGDDVNEWMLGGSYDFKAAKVYAAYQYGKGDATNYTAMVGAIAVPVVDAKLNLWSLGVEVPVSAAGKVSFEYAEARYDANAKGTDWDAIDGRSRGFGVGYKHNMSKRTMLYAGLGYMSNKDRGDGVSAPIGYKGVGESDESNWSITTGVKHTF